MANVIVTLENGEPQALAGNAVNDVPKWDGSAWVPAPESTAGAAFSYDIANGYAGTPATNAVLEYFVASTAFLINPTSTAHKFRAYAAATAASVTLRVKRNGNAVFDIVYTIGSTTGTVGAIDTAQNTVAIGDVVSIEVVGAVDADFSRPYWNINATSLSAYTYDVHGAFKGTPAASSVLDYFVASRAFSLSTTVADLLVSCGAKPSATSTTIYFKKNGVTAITATFTTADALVNGLYASTSIVVVSAPACSFAVSDVLTVETDATVDGDFSTPVWALKGTP